MPEMKPGYRPDAEGDELRIAGVAARYPLCAIVADVAHDDTLVSVGYIPKGAIIVGAIVGLKTAFNAGTTHTIDIGYGASYNEIVAAFDAKNNSAASYTLCHAGIAVQTDDKLVKAKVSQSGGASTAGAARVVVLYAIPVVEWPAETSPLGVLDTTKGRSGTHTP